jgi:hypothetical protein
MPGGIPAQPGPQWGIRIGGCLRLRQAAIGGTGKPNGLVLLLRIISGGVVVVVVASQILCHAVTS